MMKKVKLNFDEYEILDSAVLIHCPCGEDIYADVDEPTTCDCGNTYFVGVIVTTYYKEIDEIEPF